MIHSQVFHPDIHFELKQKSNFNLVDLRFYIIFLPGIIYFLSFN